MIPTYDEHDADYYNNRCYSCGKKERWLVRVYCMECGHPYLIPKLGLILHDMKVRVEMNWRKPEYETNKDPDSHVIFFDDEPMRKWKYRLISLIPRRFKNVPCCPCCVHDL